MNIQEGKYYIARNGELVGPMEESMPGNADIGSPWYSPHGALYRKDGSFGYGELFYSDLDITQTVDEACRRSVEGN